MSFLFFICCCGRLRSWLFFFFFFLNWSGTVSLVDDNDEWGWNHYPYTILRIIEQEKKVLHARKGGMKRSSSSSSSSPSGSSLVNCSCSCPPFGPDMYPSTCSIPVSSMMAVVKLLYMAAVTYLSSVVVCNTHLVQPKILSSTGKDI